MALASQKPTTAYEQDNIQLLDRLINASAKAGVSQSGLIFSPMTNIDVLNLAYLKGVVLARLEGVKPPFSPQTKVEVPEGQTARGVCEQEVLEPLTRLTVERVFYLGGGNWGFQFREKQGLFLSNHFKVVQTQNE